MQGLFQNRLIAWPPGLLAAFSRFAHPNNFTLDVALPRVISNTPASSPSVQNGPIVVAFLRTAHPNFFILDAALPCVLSNTPAKCEIYQMNGCQENRRTYRDSSIYSQMIKIAVILYSLLVNHENINREQHQGPWKVV